MDVRYTSWVEKKQQKESPTNKCAEWTRDICKKFPELTRVRGHVRWPQGGRTEHWWCLSPNGEIVDPTVKQFYGAKITYEPHREGIDPVPVGKCMWCGSHIWPPRTSGGGACSDECEKELEAEYG